MTTAEQFKDQFNGLGMDLLHAKSEEVRKMLIGMSAFALKHLLELQYDEKSTAAAGSELLYWIKRGENPVQIEGEEQLPTLSFLLEGPPAKPGMYPRLRIHVPIPEDFDTDDREAIQEFMVPRAIFPERLMQEAEGPRVLGRYAITAAHCRVYPVEDRRNASEPADWNASAARIQTHLPELAQMAEDLVNWNHIAQRKSVVGQPDVTDL
jgi:hypothetical protein